MVEIEVKIKIGEIKALDERLIEKGAKLEKPRLREENIFYDFPSQILFKKGQAIRLRKVNNKYFLTFKGPQQKSRRFKIRQEFESEVKNGKHFKKILKSLGLIPCFQYRKYRTTFRKKRLKICLDETSAGNYLELEGERNEIVRFAQALGFSKAEFIKLDYIQLIENAGKIKAS